MKLAISNIAWSADDKEAAYEIVAREGFTGIEIAPGLLFADARDAFAPPDVRIEEERYRVTAHGLGFVSMQSIFFGIEGVALFGTPTERQAFENGLLRAIALAGRLGIANLVMGAPRQRVIPDGMTDSMAWDYALDLFRRCGTEAVAQGTRISIEANPEVYGTNFLTSTDLVCDLVAQAGHSGVGINFDLGTLHLNGTTGDLERLVERAFPYLAHVHLSAPGLGPVPEDPRVLNQLFAVLASLGYAGACSIEMKALPTGLQGVRETAKRVAAAAVLG